jgi:hypothetical protein
MFRKLVQGRSEFANQCTDSRHARALASGFEDPRYGSLGYS